jgi:hypothetical protein
MTVSQLKEDIGKRKLSKNGVRALLQWYLITVAARYQRRPRTS